MPGGKVGMSQGFHKTNTIARSARLRKTHKGDAFRRTVELVCMGAACPVTKIEIRKTG